MTTPTNIIDVLISFETSTRFRNTEAALSALDRVDVDACAVATMEICECKRLFLFFFV